MQAMYTSARRSIGDQAKVIEISRRSERASLCKLYGMTILNRRLAMIVGATSLVAICFLIVPPIAQDPLYHVFADGRTLHNVPNFWNVVSNIPFFIVALY